MEAVHFIPLKKNCARRKNKESKTISKLEKLNEKKSERWRVMNCPNVLGNSARTLLHRSQPESLEKNLGRFTFWIFCSKKINFRIFPVFNLLFACGITEAVPGNPFFPMTRSSPSILEAVYNLCTMLRKWLWLLSSKQVQRKIACCRVFLKESKKKRRRLKKKELDLRIMQNVSAAQEAFFGILRMTGRFAMKLSQSTSKTTNFGTIWAEIFFWAQFFSETEFLSSGVHRNWTIAAKKTSV